MKRRYAKNGETMQFSAECFNPVAVVMRAEALAARKVMLARSHSAALVTLTRAISAMPR
jgi:hypothetical protein